MSAGAAAVVVVPCFNEAHRLDVARFAELAATAGVSLLFVDDGSTDETATILASLAARTRHVEVLELDRNRGKAEAVRAGLRHALRRPETEMVAYYDADLASPPAELLRLLATVRERPDVHVAIGARVALLGRRIERSRWRHYQGRLFASLASIILGAPVYDTQCGLKVLRSTPALAAALDVPFASRWAFDVELLGRLLRGADGSRDAIIEVPLREWHDVGGSSLSTGARVRAVVDLLALGWRSRRF